MKYGRETDDVILPTNQKFGWFFVIIFTLSTVFAFLENSYILATLFSTLAFIFIVLIIFTPNLLSGLNRLWFEFGLLLGKIVSPVVLGFIFFVLITPVAVVTRFFGRDVLRFPRFFVFQEVGFMLPVSLSVEQ